jgi:prevent-host-death family protein
MNLTTIGAREARNNFADLIGRVHDRRETVIVERAGKQMVAVIPIELYEQIIAEREACFQVVDRIHSQHYVTFDKRRHLAIIPYVDAG